MSEKRFITVILVGIILGGGMIGFSLFWTLHDPALSPTLIRKFGLAVGLCVLVSMLLGALPVLISYVQTSAKDRQLQKLNSIQAHAVAQTAYYSIAVTTLHAIKPARVTDLDYFVPIMSFSVVTMFGCLMFFLGGFPEVDALFERSTFLLGGMDVLNKTIPHEIAVYQKGTLLVGGIAFIASYIYMLGRIVERINNNDIYPISYYYYIVRFVVATLVAMVLRHVSTLMISGDSVGILLVAFAIGFVPDQFITAMLRRSFQIMKITGSQNDPEQSVLPTNLSLLMIEGLTREKIDRLTELGIDNAQVLAEQNPFIIWPRLPYSITLIVDWIAQAQLYRFSKEAGVKALRAKSISTIYDLHAGLSDAKSAQEVATVAGLCATAVAAHIASLEADPSFRHLKEVRDAL